ncbi:hypothetical protein Bbelb_272840 [Branchiostoma belcheri]|nr:hypothetical protein Bbelb_272840 [Branchiostoma belcheri]
MGKNKGKQRVTCADDPRATPENKGGYCVGGSGRGEVNGEDDVVAATRWRRHTNTGALLSAAGGFTAWLEQHARLRTFVIGDPFNVRRTGRVSTTLYIPLRAKSDANRTTDPERHVAVTPDALFSQSSLAGNVPYLKHDPGYEKEHRSAIRLYGPNKGAFSWRRSSGPGTCHHSSKVNVNCFAEDQDLVDRTLLDDDELMTNTVVTTKEQVLNEPITATQKLGPEQSLCEKRVSQEASRWLSNSHHSDKLQKHLKWTVGFRPIVGPEAGDGVIPVLGLAGAPHGARSGHQSSEAECPYRGRSRCYKVSCSVTAENWSHCQATTHGVMWGWGGGCDVKGLMSVVLTLTFEKYVTVKCTENVPYLNRSGK